MYVSRFQCFVLSFPKKRPPCRLNHPTEHPAFLFYHPRLTPDLGTCSNSRTSSPQRRHPESMRAAIHVAADGAGETLPIQSGATDGAGIANVPRTMSGKRATAAAVQREHEYHAWAGMISRRDAMLSPLSHTCRRLPQALSAQRVHGQMAGTCPTYSPTRRTRRTTSPSSSALRRLRGARKSCNHLCSGPFSRKSCKTSVRVIVKIFPVWEDLLVA